MKRIIKIIFLLIIFFTYNLLASSGPIKQDSIVECNGKYYGNHGNPIHWHEVVKKDGKWVSVSSETDIPSCYLKKVNEQEIVTLAKCGDGDTARFYIKGVDTKVRFLAIDTPEVDKSEPMSKEAKEYTCNALKKAKEIMLEYDSNSDKEDKYGRVLAFVYVDNRLLQKELISNGLAKVAYLYGDYEHVDELKKAESIAKSNKVGIWQEQSDNVEEIKEEKEETEEDSKIMQIINIIITVLKMLFDLLIN